MKKKFDKEYSTQQVDEMKWLKDHGLPYSFVKTIDGITTYKYQKSQDLFYYLYLFYKR